MCCATCNDLHGVKSAVVVTSNYLKEHELKWPNIILPAVGGIWKRKGRREPVACTSSMATANTAVYAIWMRRA
jgi:hypothetical protein